MSAVPTCKSNKQLPTKVNRSSKLNVVLESRGTKEMLGLRADKEQNFVLVYETVFFPQEWYVFFFQMQVCDRLIEKEEICIIRYKLKA